MSFFFRNNSKIYLNLFILVAYLLIYFTNINYDRETSLKLGFNDQIHYLNILNSSPSLPANEINASQAQRIIPIYAIGLFIKYFNLFDFYENFLIILIICCHFFIIHYFKKILDFFKIEDTIKLFFLFIFLCNPYIFRLSLIAPLMINDQFFILGSLMFVYYCLIKNYFFLIFAAVLISISRQTSMVFIFFIIGNIYVNLFYKKNFKDIFFLIFSILTIFCIQFFNLKFSNLFAVDNNENLIKSITEIFYLNFSLYDLTLFIARYFIANYVLFFFLTVYLLFVNKKRINSDLILILILALSITAQPLLGGPVYTAGNISRLSVLSYPFFLIFFANIFSKDKIILVLKSNLMLLLIFLSSFHHNYSIFKQINNLDYLIIILLIFTIKNIYIFYKKNET